jgi:protein SERAC1
MMTLKIRSVQSLTCKQVRRPIIFVAHGFGGLVCANAFSKHYGKNLTYKPVLDAIIGFLFLGTPFERSKEDFSRLAERYGANLKNPEEQSAKLLKIKQDFVASLKALDRLSAPLEIACFYEDVPTKEDIIIVPKNSARLPAVDSYLIHANHDEICKFKNASDSGYELISQLLEQWIRTCDVISGSRSDDSISDSYQAMVTGDIYSGNFGGNILNFGSSALGNLRISRTGSWRK